MGFGTGGSSSSSIAGSSDAQLSNPSNEQVLSFDASIDKWKNAALAGGSIAAASTSEAGIVELATNAETQAGTATNLAVTPSAFRSTIATNLSSSVAAGRIVEIQALANAYGRWPFPISYNTSTHAWPARSSVVPSWWSGPARYEALTTQDVSTPSDLITGDIVVDLYAA